MARESEFLALDDAALRAIIGPNSRHQDARNVTRSPGVKDMSLSM